MKKFTFTCLFFSALFATPAVAEFNAQEKASLKALTKGWLLTYDAMERVALSYQMSLSERQAHADALSQLGLASHFYSAAMGFFLASPNYIEGPRATDVASAWQNVNNVLGRHARTLSALALIPPNRERDHAERHTRDAVALLESMDRTLSYADFAPLSYPKSVGPHGDYDSAELALGRIGEYGAGHLTWDVTRFWDTAVSPVFTATSAKTCRLAVLRLRRTFQPFIRAWLMDSNTILDDDLEILVKDEAAGSGLRPLEFFRLLLQVEYLGSRIYDAVPNQNFSGRKLKEGMPTALHGLNKEVTDCYTSIGAVNPGWFDRQSLPSGITIGEPSPNGRIYAFVVDLSDFWRDLDGALGRWILFIHEITAPPS